MPYFLLLLYNLLFRVTESNSFNVHWAVPTSNCRKFKVDFSDIALTNKNIIQNTNDTVRGDKIVILYDPGEWPKIDIDQNGKLQYQNGGLPQNSSLDIHLRQFQIDIDRLIPNKTFDGLAVIDFECWRPIFRQNFGDLKLYRELTLLQVNKKHPTWTKDQVEAQAKIIFENAAFNFINRTMLRAKKLRPNAKWGFYGFPHCFNRYRSFNQLEKCPDIVEEENNRLLFMYSDVIYPSIYITNNQSDTALTKFVQGKMYETQRITQLINNPNTVKKLPFVRYEYTDISGFMKKADMMNILKTIKSEGGDGVILWGSSSQFKNESQCRAFKDYYERNIVNIIKDL
ncbi:hypothetical protein PVAND_006205 [Polypedilum vanderplanki]|uniref:Hyaluronidase n=1 Tax=Polypedilum vanderplanki TaxID=319348 RepID=A0A9J6C2F5_POLVA|nr:hypothetical protein PVAND_006205 [Polypedilum vanderplanki]